LWDLSQRRILLSYSSLDTTYRFYIQGLSRNVYKKLQYTLRKTPRERRSHLHNSGSLKSHVPNNQLSYFKKNLRFGTFFKQGNEGTKAAVSTFKNYRTFIKYIVN